MKKGIVFIVIWLFIPAIFSQDCGNKTLDNVGYTDWQEFINSGKKSDGVYFESKVINAKVNDLSLNEKRDFDTIVIQYPNVLGKIDLYSDEGQTWVGWPMDITEEIRKKFNYFDDVPSWEDVYVHRFKYQQLKCPKKEISQVHYRADRQGNVQVRFNENHYQYIKDYDVFYDIVIEKPKCRRARAGRTLKFAESVSVYNGICGVTDEIGTHLIVKAGKVLFFNGLRREKEHYVITDEDWMINIQSEEKTGVQFYFDETKKRIDFVVVE